ncbi:hypothetical protein [Lachnoclostridium sp. Marseille-P6806]|uniref:hypothetical protein n=1 Tax=Lachnoclostridium sp. Marseille-P6806 TaxID=2364793 RepID=UPI00103007CA|nr:hypothetical protein [Lachnoclostridium sp. Marseille-P6806]
MFLPEIDNDNNSRSMISTWRGYNHNYRIGDGEFYDVLNLSSDHYPLLSPRKKRVKLIEDKNIRGAMLSDNTLCYLAGDILHYGSKTFDFAGMIPESTSEQQIVRFGAYALIFPLGLYANLITGAEHGRIGSSYTAGTGVTITYTMCDSTGDALHNVTAGAEAPESPSDGDYWLDTKAGEEGLNIWDKSQSMWKPVATTYIKISIPGSGLDKLFSVDDTVTMNSALTDINNGSVIQAIGTDYIVVIGLIASGVTYSETTDSAWTFHMERKVPKLDYVCVDDNRVWGCHYGAAADGEMVNEIYASKLGDFRNWYSYSGIATDSYALSVGVGGEWTGCISYRGYPTFFKEDAIFRIFGSVPAEYQLSVSTCRGVQKGSYRSLAVVSEYLIYKSASDVVVYDGSSPVSISAPLGREQVFYDAVGGGCLGKYHVAMQTAKGERYYFVYDMQNHLWEREDALGLRWFTASENGQIYALTETAVYGIGANDNALFAHPLVSEETVEWVAETGDIGLDAPEYQWLNSLTLRVYIAPKSEVQVWVSYDDNPFEELITLRGIGTVATHTIPAGSPRHDHFRIRFAGHGDMRLYTLSMTIHGESEENGEYHF